LAISTQTLASKYFSQQ